MTSGKDPDRFHLPLGYHSGYGEEKGEGQEKGDSFITVMLLSGFLDV